MPSACTSSRGAALNWRLAVNGIQCASSSAASGRGTSERTVIGDISVDGPDNLPHSPTSVSDMSDPQMGDIRQWGLCVGLYLGVTFTPNLEGLLCGNASC